MRTLKAHVSFKIEHGQKIETITSADYSWLKRLQVEYVKTGRVCHFACIDATKPMFQMIVRRVF